jgi:hypothetical protein
MVSYASGVRGSQISWVEQVGSAVIHFHVSAPGAGLPLVIDD